MARQEKKTRVRGLPPRVFLQQKDARTGSLPTIARIASDNRTGMYGVSFDDTNVINFVTSSNFVLGVGISYNQIVRDQFQEFGSDLVTTQSLGIRGPLIFDDSYDPIALYIFDGSAEALDDRSGNGYNLVHIARNNNTEVSESAPLYLPGPFADTMAVRLSGSITSDNVILRTSAALDPAIDHLLMAMTQSQTTIQMIMRSRGNGGARSDLLGIVGRPYVGSVSDNARPWQVELRSGTDDHELLVYHHDFAQNEQSLLYNRNLDPDWHHVAFVKYRDVGPEWKIYYDGVLVEDSIGGGSFGEHTDGSNMNELQFAYGTRIGMDVDIAGVKIVPTALSASVILEEYDKAFNRNLSSNTGRTVTGIGDTFMAFTPGQSMEPFRDFGNPAIDQISKPVGSQNSFYATGSAVEDVGLGFATPVWSKTKIEIDLTCAEDHEFGLQNNVGTDENYPMAYWNPTAKRFQGIGPGYEFTRYDVAPSASSDDDGRVILKQLCEELTIGFGHSIDSNTFSPRSTANYGQVISNFGFPYHKKYHATSSNLISLQDYISEPFLAEKIVIEWSGSCDYNTPNLGSADNPQSQFFIMNQRSGTRFQNHQRVYFVSGGSFGNQRTIVTASSTAFSPDPNSLNSSRDLVTWATVAYWTEFPGIPTLTGSGYDEDSMIKATRRELNLGPSSGSVDATGLSALRPTHTNPAGSEGWTGRFVMSGVIKTPIGTPEEIFNTTGTPQANGLYNTVSWHKSPGSQKLEYGEQLQRSGRAGLGAVGGRDLLSPVESPPSTDTTVNGLALLDRLTHTKVNPYVLQPTDKLILGWQVPMTKNWNLDFGDNVEISGSGPQLGFKGGAPAKLIIYGSKISEGVEDHDTLNQLLTSNNVHEVIK